MVGPVRPKFVLFGSSIVRNSFSNEGWGAILATLYARKRWPELLGQYGVRKGILSSVEEVVFMEAEGGSGDPRKMDVYGSNGGNLNKQILDFEEIIRDTGEANQYDPGVSNLKRDIPNKLLNKIGNSSNQEVDGVSGNITKHTGLDFK
ncbi:gdsl esterase/lipase cprd49 [Quercus suber]|uniref:Gdsl esterase/lipase cprd49 n=1 Tax=Quercus suber TaxID=58331 RepID=A0AAW0L260_QUESU